MPLKNMLKFCVSVKMMNDEKTIFYGTTYSLSAETFDAFEILCVVNPYRTNVENRVSS